MRLDTYLAESKKARSRTHAAVLIKEGLVTVNEKTAVKPAMEITEQDHVVVISSEDFFVSRGGQKLNGALETLGWDVTGLRCVDIGASTGGFTDCLLRRGAAYVVAVDAGTGQLAPELLHHEKVRNLENCNARYMTAETLGGLCDLAVADVSFISQTLLLPAVTSVLREEGKYICLVKPQFECGREALNKNGIVRDKKYHLAALRKVLAGLIENGLNPLAVMPSSITGGDGNREFLLAAVKKPGVCAVSDAMLREVVYEKDS